MKRAIFSIIIPVAALSLALTAFVPVSSAQITTVACPAGYTCTPAPVQPVNCPAGFICTPNTSGGGGGGGVIIPPTPVIPTTSACYTWSTNLTIGSTGADVVALQTWLMGNGFDIPALSQGRSQRGYYGATTAAAVAKYQASVGIPATGFLGALTRAALNGSCTTTNPGQASITVISPKQGDVYAIGNSIPITWGGSWSGNDTFNIQWGATLSSGGEKGGSIVTTLTQTQAGCTGYGKGVCGYSWIPTYQTGPIQITIFKNGTNVSGISGSFSVSSATTPVCPVGYTCVYTPGTPAQGNCPAGYICTPTTPIPTSGATVTVNGRPTLTLAYDSAQKESALTATFNVTVNGGTTGINIYKIGGGAQFIDQKGVSYSANSISSATLTPQNSVIGTGADNYGQTFFIVPAGHNIGFQAVVTADPRQLFAGTYHSSLISIWANPGKDINSSFNLQVPTNQTNSKTIIGEVSPYISSVTPSIVSPGQTLTLQGQRLNGSSIFIDNSPLSNVVVTGPISGTSLSFAAPSLSNGYHTVQVKNDTTGASNQVSFQVQSATTQPSITVLSPNGGQVLQQGQPLIISWTGQGMSTSANFIVTIFNGPTASYSYPNTDIASGLQSAYSYSWIVAGNNGSWGVGIGPILQKFADMLGTKIAEAASNQYVIQVCEFTYPSGSNSNVCGSTGVFTINSTTSAQSPVISGGTFPTTLNVGQTGTWTVNASDPNNGSLSYSVNWGDTSSCPAGYTCVTPAMTASAFIQSSTFTHSYSSAGTYTATFTVKNASGLSAQTTSTVQVGNSPTNGPLSISSISPNTGYAVVPGTMLPTAGNITIYGSGFTQGDTVSLFIVNPMTGIKDTMSQKTAGVTSISPTMITASLPAFNSGNYSVQVSYNGQTSNAVPYAINLQNMPPASFSVIQSETSASGGSDTYINPRLYTQGWPYEIKPANDAASATAWCKAVSGKSYTSGSFSSNPYSAEDDYRYDFNGSQWTRMIQGEYAGYYQCSGLSVSQGQIVATLDSSSPLQGMIQISAATQTQNVPLAVFDIKSQNAPATLNALNLNLNVGGASTQNLLTNIQIRAGGLTYSASSVGGSSASFTNIQIPLPADAYVPITVYATIAADSSGMLNGSTASVSLSANNSNVVAVDQSYNTVSVSNANLSGSTLSFVSGGGAQISNTSASSGSPITCASGNTTINCGVNLTFSFTLTAANSTIFISSDPSVALGTTVTGGGTLSLPIGGVTANPGLLSGDTNTSATGGYYVIPAGSSRQFTFIGAMTSSGTNSLSISRINQINYGTNTSSLQANSITQGLSGLSVTATLSAPQTNLTSAIWNAVQQYLNSRH